MPQSPSFDCKKAASKTEKLICADAELSGLDRQMAERYQKILQAAQPGAKAGVRFLQRQWLAELPDRCSEEKSSGPGDGEEPKYESYGASPTACLKSLYEARVKELEIRGPGALKYVRLGGTLQVLAAPGRKLEKLDSFLLGETLDCSPQNLSETEPALGKTSFQFWALCEEANPRGYGEPYTTWDHEIYYSFPLERELKAPDLLRPDTPWQEKLGKFCADQIEESPYPLPLSHGQARPERTDAQKKEIREAVDALVAKFETIRDIHAYDDHNWSPPDDIETGVGIRTPNVFQDHYSPHLTCAVPLDVLKPFLTVAGKEIFLGNTQTAKAGADTQGKKKKQH